MTTPRIEEMVSSVMDSLGVVTDTDKKTILQSLTQAYQAGIDEAVEGDRDRIEQAHMAGYHSCCGRDSSYSEARNYYDTTKALQDKK